MNTSNDFQGDRHLHAIFTESINFMGHFRVWILDIHKKKFKEKKIKFKNGRHCCGPEIQKYFRRRLLKNNFT